MEHRGIHINSNRLSLQSIYCASDSPALPLERKSVGEIKQAIMISFANNSHCRYIEGNDSILKIWYAKCMVRRSLDNFEILISVDDD